ncbi:transcription factor SOX-9-like [Nothobranchius furzeri]|uniref:Transcription factor SOX-9-like n=1 Tax=Nothobranchius furzeri TaxID=105023 RepID=A0A9D2XCU8_NOTFU|nr:transcription factor SOX-9-like [Nothobranchius furzeri]
MQRELQQLRLQQPPEPQAQPLEPQAQPPEPQAQPLEPQAQPSEPQRSPQQPEVDTRGTKLKLTFSSASEELTETEAPVPKKKNKSEKSKRTKKAISPHTAHTFSDTVRKVAQEEALRHGEGLPRLGPLLRWEK